MNQPSSLQAREMLRQASLHSHHSAAFMPAWLAYIFFCAAGSAYASIAPLASLAWLDHNATLFTVLVSSLWFAPGLILSIVYATKSDPARRGFGKRWGIMMVLWGLSWVLTVFVSLHITVWQSLALTCLFVGLAVVGPAWEVKAVRRKKHQ